MPRSKNWRKSAAKKDNKSAVRTTKEGLNVPSKNTSPVNVQAGLNVPSKNTSPVKVQAFNVAKEKPNESAEQMLNEFANSCLRAQNESAHCRLRAQNESAHSLRAQNESANSCLRAQNESANSCFRAQNKSSSRPPCAQRGDDESQSSCPSVETIFASHNQGDGRYSVFSRGCQCTCMSLSVILTMFEDNEFSTSYLDRVLYRGDNLYKKVVMDLMNEHKFKSKLLSFDELPRALEYNDKLFNITKHASVIGIPIIDSSTNEAFSLQEAIVFAFSKSDNLLIMIGAICSALVRRSNTYIFFDSHSHGKDALSNADGKAVMKIFPLLDDVIAFLYAFYNSANIELTSQFEILPVSLQQIMHRFLDSESEERQSTSRPNLKGTDKFTKNTTNSGNFLNFQPTNTTKHTDRQSYMRQYMQKRRQDAKFRQKERKTEVLGKRTAREDPEYRDKERKTERIGKRTARENPEYHNKELLGKRTAREDPEYRDKERKTEVLGKRTAREDPEYRDKERKTEVLGKRTAREDPEYRDKERKTERIGKRTARENPEYHNKELLGKRTAREDPEYRDKERKTELLGKRTAREDPEYRDKERKTERIGKRTARKNPEYHNKEYACKTYC